MYPSAGQLTCTAKQFPNIIAMRPNPTALEFSVRFCRSLQPLESRYVNSLPTFVVRVFIPTHTDFITSRREETHSLKAYQILERDRGMCVDKAFKRVLISKNPAGRESPSEY